MLRLNIRHQLPQIGMNIQHSRVNEAHDNQAINHGSVRQARSTKGFTQARIDINAYQSRHSYGNSTMGDFTRENGQRGISDVQSAVASHAQETWSEINNASKPGNYIRNRAEQERQSDMMQQRYLVAIAVPDATTTVEEASQSTGDIDVGETRTEYEVPRAPTIDITTGSVETYIQNQGFLRQWTTQDQYDIYA